MYSNILLILYIIVLLYIIFIDKKTQENYVSSFTTNKFKYEAGYISPDGCKSYCDTRYEECKSYFPTGSSNWCGYLKDKCRQDCSWNDVYNK